MNPLSCLHRPSAATAAAAACATLLAACAYDPSHVGQIQRLSPEAAAALPAPPAPPPPAVAAAPVDAQANTAAPPSAVAALTGRPSAAPPVMHAQTPVDGQPVAAAPGNGSTAAPTAQQIARDQQISAQILRDQEAEDRAEAAARAYAYASPVYAAPYPYYGPVWPAYPFNYGSVWYGSGWRGGHGHGHGHWGGRVGIGF